MIKCLLIGLIFSVQLKHLIAAPVFVCEVNEENIQFKLDAASFIRVDFSPDRFSPLYGDGQVKFEINNSTDTLKFALSKDNLMQVWHNENEFKVIFHDESSFQYDKVHGDDLTLKILTTSQSGKAYTSNYMLTLRQYGFKNYVNYEGKIECKKSIRYHQ